MASIIYICLIYLKASIVKDNYNVGTTDPPQGYQRRDQQFCTFKDYNLTYCYFTRPVIQGLQLGSMQSSHLPCNLTYPPLTNETIHQSCFYPFTPNRTVRKEKRNSMYKIQSAGRWNARKSIGGVDSLTCCRCVCLEVFPQSCAVVFCFGDLLLRCVQLRIINIVFLWVSHRNMRKYRLRYSMNPQKPR